MRACISAVLLSVGITGCPQNDGGPRNGVDRVLYFSDVDFKSDLGGVALGVIRRVTVQRYIGGTRVCEPSLSHGGGDCSGGAEQDLVTLESARCESFECKVELGREGDTPVVRFSSSTAGKTRLRVNVKSKDDGETYSDAIEVRFAEAKRIALRSAGEGSFLPLAMPVYRGLEFGAPLAEIQDADREWLKIDRGYVPMKTDGASVSVSGARLLTIGLGVTKLTWEVEGVISRTVEIDVIEPAAEQSLVVIAARAPGSLLLDRKRAPDFDDFLPVLDAPPPSVFEHDSKAFSVGDQPMVFARLVDGRRAVVPLVKAEIAPPLGTATARIDERAPWVVTLAAPGVPGDTTLHLEAGGANASIPLKFAPKP
jgi:hypothetical protein